MTIAESNINRLIKWINKHDIATVTAFRGTLKDITPNTAQDVPEGHVFTHKENRERNRNLCALLLRYGYGLTKISGVYPEGNTNLPKDEESFIVVNLNDDPNFYERIFKASEYFNQDSFLFKAKGGDDVGYLIGTNNCDWPGYGQKCRAGKFLSDVQNAFMSRLGNRGFAFSDEENLDQYSTTHQTRKDVRNQIRTQLRDIDIVAEQQTYAGLSIGSKRIVHETAVKLKEKLLH